jgi:hypothetical protein
MKRCMLMIVVAVLFYSCEDLETNTPAMQGSLDNSFFEATDARAAENEDGSFTIIGITDSETLTLKVAAGDERTYNLGGESPNYASFENSLGNIYSTNPEGEGQVVISNWDTANETLSGTFRFNAVLSGQDTLNVQRGVFFEVPYGTGIVEEGTPPNAGTFLAEIDGTPFNPFTVTAVDSGNSIVIAGSTSSTTVLIRMPIDVMAGTYSLTEIGFQASYTDGINTQQATAGTLLVVEHNPGQRRVKGTFSFETASTTVSLGQFNVVYE